MSEACCIQTRRKHCFRSSSSFSVLYWAWNRVQQFHTQSSMIPTHSESKHTNACPQACKSSERLHSNNHAEPHRHSSCVTSHSISISKDNKSACCRARHPHCEMCGGAERKGGCCKSGVDVSRVRTRLLHNKQSCSWSSRVWWFCIFYFLLCCCVLETSGQMQPTKDTYNKNETGICRSIDIRNSVAKFNALKGCRVVEGFVHIVLIDHSNESDFENLSFPELHEITDYLLMYRVRNLKTLSNIFPNLSVIRGNVLFMDYALVIFEMMQMQEIGLTSLTDILRGGVRIEKNPMLCYVNTIDWDLIAKKGKGSHFIMENQAENECPNSCPAKCSGVGFGNRSLCWNMNTCQKVCDKSCDGRTCYKGGCCHAQCLGGCNGTRPDDCISCKGVKVAGRCVTRCPPPTYEYLQRRCVTEQECYNMPQPENFWLYTHMQSSWKPFKLTSSCLLNCPANYTQEKNNSTNRTECVKCKGKCNKMCFGRKVDNRHSAQILKGCTHIDGDLLISMTGGNIVEELEENLSSIEEIYGYLDVSRSYPLVSLNFLRNLRVIHGAFKTDGKLRLKHKLYSFIVFENANLQELWDWTNRSHKLEIRNGRPFIHLNPKLCLEKINYVLKMSNITNVTEIEVGEKTNGDRVPCKLEKLDIEIGKRNANAAVIGWQRYDSSGDKRILLGYALYITEAPRNISLYGRRDECGGDGWRVFDIAAERNDSLPPLEQHLVAHLKPATRYATYVKTYTTSSENKGAQSDILYFWTYSDKPSYPRITDVYSNSSSEIVLKWQKPLTTNGNVTYYHIVAVWKEDSQEYLDERDYCKEPIDIHTVKQKNMITEKKIPGQQKAAENGTCECSEKQLNEIPSEEAVQQQINFENFLQNIIFSKRPVRQKRDTHDDFSTTISSMYGGHSPDGLQHDDSFQRFPPQVQEEREATQGPPVNGSKNMSVGGIYHRFEINVTGTEFVVSNLTHFGEYDISITACRDPDPLMLANNESDHNLCSIPAIVTARTMKREDADNITITNDDIEVSNETIGMVKLKWKEPKQPNGVIVAYHVEYKKIDLENHKAVELCITRRQFIDDYKRSYTLKRLPPGNYSLRLKATSLAGYGYYTEQKFFVIQEASTSTVQEVIIAACVSVVLIFVLAAGAFFYWRKIYDPKVRNMRLIASVNPEYFSSVYVPDEWEVPRKKIELIRELGQGSFGMVYEGIARDIKDAEPEIRCAVKTVNEQASDRDRGEFLNEASVMKGFKTHHVLQLLGVVSQGQPTLVIMELMSNGDLKTYLRSHRPDVAEGSRQPPTLRRILRMAIEVADGMAYLAAKKFVHRDLAARNCMVAEDLTVKIGDFGMTRDIYETDYYRKGTKGLLPVRWMAPESLKDGIFTSHSDVWSYGVVLWEMATLASQPYQGLSNDQVLRYVIDGGVMERPENCPDKLYELMRMCWQHKPQSRPTFLELVSLLIPDVNSSFAQVSFYHSDEGRELRAHDAGDENEDHPVTPATPLRVSRDIEDFSVGSGSEMEFDDDDDVDGQVSLEIGRPSVLSPHLQTIMSSARSSVPPPPPVTLQQTAQPSQPQVQWSSGENSKGVYSSDSSKGSKVSNGSTANGYVMGRHGPNVMKTTEC